MGYTTKFEGEILLSSEVPKDLLRLFEKASEGEAVGPEAPNSYCDFVIDENRIIWDEDSEKFYDYDQWLVWMVEKLAMRGIRATGSLRWQGEDIEDSGFLIVDNSKVYRSGIVMQPKASWALISKNNISNTDYKLGPLDKDGNPKYWQKILDSGDEE